MNKNILKYFGLAALFVFGAKADAEDATPETLASLVAAAENGATVTLGAGTFTLAGSSASVNKTITLVGKGAGETTFVVGNGTSDGNQGTSDGCFNGSHATLKDMKIVEYPGFTIYLGFLTGDNSSLEFVGCTFENTHFSNWSRDNRFVGCTFTQSNTSWYNVQELRGRNGDRYYFESCEFFSTGGRFINAYKQGGTGTTVYLTVKNCSFSGETQSKAAVNLKSAPGDGCCLQLDFLGENKTTNVKAGSNTGDPLFDDNGNYAVVTSNGSKIWENGQNVEPQSSAVAKIGETEYATINEAFAAVNGQAGDDVIVKILGDVTESLTADYMWTKNVTLMTEVDGGVSVDLGFRGGSAGVWALLENAAGKTLSVREGVSIAGLAQLFAGYTGAPNTVVNLAGDLTVDQIWAFDGGTVNIMPTSKVIAYSYGDGMVKIRYDGAINVTGNGQDEVQFVAGYIDCDYNGNKELNLTNTSVTAGFIANSGTGRFTLNMSNAKLVVSHELPRGINFGSSAVGTINMSADSCIVVDKIANVTAINVNAAGATEPVKVIDYTGTAEMTLEKYGTVTVMGGEAYVEDNDLWVKAKVETKVVVPDESEIKPVDEEGKEITGDDAEKAKEAAKEAVEELGRNSGAQMTEGTGVEAAVFAPGEEVKADVAQGLQTAAAVVTQDDKGVDLTKDEQDEVKAKVADIATSKDVSSYVKIDVKSPVVKVEDAVATVKTLVFDVQPMAVSKVTTTIDASNPKTVTVEAPVDYNDSAKPITFRLPLTDAFTVSAIVTHEGDPDRLCMVQGTAGARYVEMSATHFSLFSVAPSDIVETSASSKTILGIKRIDYTVTQTTADLAAAVPWLKAADEDMPVSKLITTGLSSGDMIQVYDLAAKTYYGWHYDGTSWTADALSKGGTSPSAEAYTLKRGSAFWYKPGSVSGTYTQVGLFSDLSSVTTKVNNVHADLTPASFAKPVHNLLASPKYEDFSVPDALTAKKGCVKDDVVVIVATGARYRFDGTTWGQDVDREVAKFGVTVTQKSFVPIGEADVGDGVVPAGTAFWYLSAGGAPEFAW